MRCKHNQNIECEIFKNTKDCWYEDYHQCQFYRRIREEQAVKE